MNHLILAASISRTGNLTALTYYQGRSKKCFEYKVNGHTINLYDLEHDIIIPLGEPRIHFARNCASASCPALSDRPYLADTLEQQLEEAAVAFINDSSRKHFDYATKIAYLYEIFDWFAEDFTKHSGDIRRRS